MAEAPDAEPYEYDPVSTVLPDWVYVKIDSK